MARVLIAGCGYVGNRLAEILRDDGDAVIGLRRTVAALPPDVEPLEADLLRPETLDALPRGIDSVVYAAAAADPSDSAYRAAYVDGLSNLLAALARRGERPGRLVFTSSTGVFPQDDGSLVDESTPVDVEGRVDRVREGERIAAASGIETVVVRFGGIYGPGRTRLIESVVHGTIEYPIDPPLWTNRIHREDCARVLRHVMHLRAPAKVAPLYAAVDDEPCPLADVVHWLAARLGVALPPPSTPVGFRESREADGLGESGGRGKRVRNDLLRASGYRFVFPSFREGYAAVLPQRSGP